MFGIGSSELLIIIIVALLVLGPKRLPEVLKILGRMMAEFKRTAEEVKKEIGAEQDLKDIKDSLQEISDVPRLVQMQMEKEIEELKKLEQEALAEEKTDDGAGEKEEPKG
jgi:Tat protein translocase TatB subunit